MTEVQIYIEDQRIDVFNQESLGVTSKIQDAKEIEKVFTDFTYPFTIPASDTNNKVFKHFYEYSVINGYDARRRKEAKIFINNLLFRRGKVFLQNVEMRNKKPYSYTIVFYGNTITLKDLASDLTLRDLDLSDFDHEYSFDNVQSFMSSGLTVNDDDKALIYPLITSKRRLFYNSVLNTENKINYSGNIYFPGTGDSHIQARGLNYEDLKPAIKIRHIISAIETKLGISFIKDDFIDTTPLDNLYFWLSNKTGNITNQQDDSDYFFKKTIDNYTYITSTDNLDYFSVSGDTFTVNGVKELTGAYRPRLIVNMDPAGNQQDVPWKIKVIQDNGKVFTHEGSGDQEIEFQIGAFFSEEDAYDRKYKIEVYSKSALNNLDFGVSLRTGLLTTETEKYISYDIDLTGRVIASSEISDMKIIDFLTSLFKMFNLTAFYIDDESDPNFGKIKVITLDDYYADAVNNLNGSVTDIGDYIDISSHNVSTILPFSDVSYKYKENETLLMQKHYESTGKEFGNSKFSLKENFNLDTGDAYEIEIEFDHLKYERLRDQNGETLTEIQWGYAAGGDFNRTENTEDDDSYAPPDGDYDSTELKNLIFYAIHRQGISQQIAIFQTNQQSSTVVDYFMPSNSNEIGTLTDPPGFTLNFDSEIDEYSLIDYGLDTNSLFNKFHKKYISSVLASNKRIFKFKAYFPLSFIVNYKLNDQLKIQDRIYRINSISTNILDGETNLELVNLNADEIV